MAGPDAIYHERQSRQLCALHVLNNLFQDEKAFTKADLDDICRRLNPEAWINPHKSMLGLGNYDANVIMTALEERGFKMRWFDKRKDVDSVDFGQTFGVILNVPSDFKFLGFVPLPWNRKHWITLKYIPAKDVYYNLDSNLNEPALIGKMPAFLTFVKEKLRSDETEMILVVEENVENSSLYKT